MNGYFGNEEPHVCDKFYYCVDGKFNMITCPDGLVFNNRSGICTWPDEAQKAGCSSEGCIFFKIIRRKNIYYFYLFQTFSNFRVQRYLNR